MWGLGPQKNFLMLSFEMLNFYAFWTLEQGEYSNCNQDFHDIGTSGSWGPLSAGGALVHCTTCTTYCYATVKQGVHPHYFDKNTY